LVIGHRSLLAFYPSARLAKRGGGCKHLLVSQLLLTGLRSCTSGRV